MATRRIAIVSLSNSSLNSALQNLRNAPALAKRFFSSSPTLSSSSSSVFQPKDPLQELPIFSPLGSDPYQTLISPCEIVERQRSLLQASYEQLCRISNSVVKQTPLILVASNSAQFQGDTAIPIADSATSSDFQYLTGLHSGASDQLTADCVIAIQFEEPENANSNLRTTLFAPTRTKSESFWNGPDLQTSEWRPWIDSIAQNDIRPLSSLTDYVNASLKHRQNVFISKNCLIHRPELVTNARFVLGQTSRTNQQNLATIRDLSPLIDSLRVIKSPQESLALIRASRIGVDALKSTMAWTRAYSQALNESQIAAKFMFESKMNGARRLSFPPVIAAGPSSTIVHYGQTNKPVYANDWLLTDVGVVEQEGYCSDLTRCWTAQHSYNSCLTTELYQALAGVQEDLISHIQVGVTTLDDLQKIMLHHLGRLLASFNVFSRPISGHNELMSLTRRICPHHVSHYIGLDIHDTPTILRSKPLIGGMCFSLEPGLYFPQEHSGNSLPIRKEFLGIGLRIEDDMLVCPVTGKLLRMTEEIDT